MKKVALMISVVLNIILIVLIVAGIRYVGRTSFQTMVNATTDEVCMQENFLKELESGDSKRIEAVKEMMRRNIEIGKKVASGNWGSEKPLK